MHQKKNVRTITDPSTFVIQIWIIHGLLLPLEHSGIKKCEIIRVAFPQYFG